MKDLIKEARELCEKATPGPWKVKLHNEDYGQGYGETTFFVDIDGTLLKIDIADTAEKYAKYSALSTFIARSRSLIPELCDALEKSRWIPVSERLPEREGEYLVFCEGEDMYNCFYEETVGEFGSYNDCYDPKTFGYVDSVWYKNETVTHWMCWNG